MWSSEEEVEESSDDSDDDSSDSNTTDKNEESRPKRSLRKRVMTEVEKEIYNAELPERIRYELELILSFLLLNSHGDSGVPQTSGVPHYNL